MRMVDGQYGEWGVATMRTGSAAYRELDDLLDQVAVSCADTALVTLLVEAIGDEPRPACTTAQMDGPA